MRERGPKGSHCSYCGGRYPEDSIWPKRCAECEATTWANPLPVAVAVVPVGSGLLTVRRAAGGQEGKLALPGGFLELGESWQQGCARELREESGLEVDPAGVTVEAVLSAPDGTLLVFGRTPPVPPEQVAAFTANAEVSELVVLDAPAALAFPLHEQVARAFFEG